MVNSDLSVQECDATNADSSITVDNKINGKELFTRKNYLTLAEAFKLVSKEELLLSVINGN